jgi:aspartate/methionine/tyrosine aminotransferase
MLMSREMADRRWSPDRPDGFVDLSVAENRLVWDLIEPELSRARPLPARSSGYDDMRGSGPFRRSVAAFAGRTFLGRAIDPDSIATLAGAGAVLEAVFYALCDAGDGVLVATPGYAGFWMDLENRDEAVIVPVPTRWDDGFRITTEALDRAYESAERPIKALLVASPDNPSGRVLTGTEICELVAWCRGRGIHAVFDEIYALSIHGDVEFTSVASLTDLAEDVHIIWALSKDFAVSGLRCGVLITENERLGRAVSSQGIWSGVSGGTQHLFAELLEDEGWTDSYVAEMQARLRRAHDVTRAELAAADIPHQPGEAGFFLLADLSGFLSEPSFEAERSLWRRFVAAGVNVTPGAACRAHTPGIIRICFAAVPTEAVGLGVRRLASALH